MAFLRVEGKFPTHAKVLALGRGPLRARAVGLWTMAGCWSQEHVTDGHVPRSVVSDLGCSLLEANALVRVRLWHDWAHDCPGCPQPTKDGDFVFHDWLKHGNWSRAEVTERKSQLSEVRAAAGRRGGLASGKARREATKQNPSIPTYTDTDRFVSQSHRWVTQARENPAQIETWRSWCGEGVDLDAELAAWERFNADKIVSDPEAALRGWLRSARIRGSAKPKPGCGDCLGGWLPDEYGQPSNRRCPTCRPPRRRTARD